MWRDSHAADQGTNSESASFTRRTALALLGAGGASTMVGSAAGREGSRGRDGRPWNQDVDAQGHALYDLGALEVGHTYTRARNPDVVVWRDDEGVYHADTATETAHSDEDYFATIQAGIDSLDDDRDSAGTVLVVSSGTVGPADELTQLILPSDIVLDVPATIYVEDEGTPLVNPIRAFGEENVTIPRLSIVGNPRFGIWIQSTDDVTLGAIDIRFKDLEAVDDYDEPDREWPPTEFDPGASREEILAEPGFVGAWNEGIRVDGRAREEACENLRIQNVTVEGGGHHAVETYDTRRVQVGSVIATDQESCAVILNETQDATVNSVIGDNPEAETWYATFRCANNCQNVTVGQVVSRDAPRGIHVTTDSDDVTIGEVNIVGARYSGIRVDGVENFTVQGGLVKNVIEEAVASWEANGFSVSNLRIVDDLTPDEREEMLVPPGSPDGTEQTHGIVFSGQNGRIVNNDVRNGGSEELIDVESPSTVVSGNVGDGIDSGEVVLQSDEEPAAVVETGVEYPSATLDLRASVLLPPEDPFAWDHHFRYDGEWEIVFEWIEDPGEELELEYIVDQPQAERGTEIEYADVEPGTYSITSLFNDEDVVVSVEGELGDGANVYKETTGEASHQEWEVTEVDGGYRIAAADDTDYVLEAEDGGEETGTNLVVGEWDGSDYQIWDIVPHGHGQYTLEPTHADLAADVWEQDSDPGADVRHWDVTAGDNQLWQFQDVSE